VTANEIKPKPVRASLKANRRIGIERGAMSPYPNVVNVMPLK